MRLNLQDLDATFEIRRVNHDLPVEAPWSEERGIQNVRSIRGRKNHHAFMAGKAVHFRENLVQRLLALVVTSYRDLPVL